MSINKINSSTLTCYHCGKIIKNKATITNPPIYLVRLGLDFSKAYHEKCYRDAEKVAEQELISKVQP